MRQPGNLAEQSCYAERSYRQEVVRVGNDAVDAVGQRQQVVQHRRDPEIDEDQIDRLDASLVRLAPDGKNPQRDHGERNSRYGKVGPKEIEIKNSWDLPKR